jgi:hypothetical protein
MERMAVEVQNFQLFLTGLLARPFDINSKFLLGAAGHYQQRLLAICESCKLKHFFI